MTDTYVKTPNPRIKERSSHTITAYFRSAGAASAPATIHYRIDDLTTKTLITDWTSVSAAASVSITVKSSENRIISDSDKFERRQITVAADKGTDNETRDTAEWRIENIGGFDEAEA